MTNKIPCATCGALILPATASANGGICMRCKREGPPARSEMVKRAYATPARCISPFKLSTTGAAIPAGNPRDQAVRFQLACVCGCGEFSILGFPMPSPAYADERIFAAPIALRCQGCRRTERLFNPAHDGYDGEINSSAGVLGSGEPGEFECPHCRATPLSVAVSLQYSLGDEEMDDWEELAARPQDFFTSFGLFGCCARCGHRARVTDYECA